MLFNFLSMGDPIIAIIGFLLVFFTLVFCITVHEFSHAFIAYKLGDPTAKSLGRVTLNPFSHLDPWGTLLLIVFGFGWGKPVPFNPQYFSNPRLYSALVSLAGPLSNFLFAVIFAFIKNTTEIPFLESLFEILVYINLVLCFFNLIPVNPLDGFKIVWGFLPQNLAFQWMELAPYGVYILLIMIFTNVTDILVSTPVQFFVKLLL